MLRRLLKYNLVGALGTTLKLATVFVLHGLAGAGYMAATAVSVEAAMLHNFAWHLHWTWRERSSGISARDVGARLLRFQLNNAALSMLTSLVMMRVLVEGAGMHYLAANLLAAATSGAVNFVVSDRWIFTVTEPRR